MLGSEVDFNTELQPGDHFRLIVDKQYRADDVRGTDDVDLFANYGSIQAVEFEMPGARFRRFATPRKTADGLFRQQRSLHPPLLPQVAAPSSIP